MATDRHIVAVTGSGAVGWHPLDRRTWSGSSRAFFLLLQERGQLFRAFGVEAPWIQRGALLFKNFNTDYQRFRKQFYTDPAYRNALTRAVRAALREEDFDHDVMQIGAMFSAPDAVQGKTRCLCYMDSNVAVSLRSPYAPKGLSAARVDRILAYERHVYQSLTSIFTAGRYLRDSLISDFSVPADKITVLGMGVNLPAIPDSIEGKDYDRKELLYLGSDFARKGGPVLLRAFALVRRSFPRARLHIVGPAALKIPPELAGGVEHHGHLLKTKAEDWRVLDALFRRCTLFVLPSVYEPFGIAPLEAMVYQTPCVATDIQALREFVLPGKTGELVEVNSVDALADALRRMLSDPAALQRMGTAARAMVLENYTWPRVVDRFLAVRDRLTEAPAPTPMCFP